MIYADTSALAKLVRAEAETQSLRAWLSERRDQPVITNLTGVVELQRFARRVSREVEDAATLLLRRLDRIDLTGTTFALAADVPPATVRTLGALHIASAVELPGVTAFVTYDERQASAAEAFGLRVVSPA
jgi:predicted nucleic acid-binding protein